MFVTIEGIDGSGKSTVIEAIEEEYPNAVITHEPSDYLLGQILRPVLKCEDTNPLLDFYLFMADRVNHAEQRVKPAVEQGMLVVCDRYADSTRAYQPVALAAEDGPFESGWQAKMFIEETMKPWNYEPDLTIYVDVSVDTALDRLEPEQKFEKREFLEQVKENYDALADMNDRIVRVDGERSPEAVAASAVGKIDVVSPDRL